MTYHISMKKRVKKFIYTKHLFILLITNVCYRFIHKFYLFNFCTYALKIISLHTQKIKNKITYFSSKYTTQIYLTMVSKERDSKRLAVISLTLYNTILYVYIVC